MGREYGSMLGAAVDLPILIDGIPTYRIGIGQYVIVRVATGRHVFGFWMATSEHALAIDVAAGERYGVIVGLISQSARPTPTRSPAPCRSSNNEARAARAGVLHHWPGRAAQSRRVDAPYRVDGVCFYAHAE